MMKSIISFVAICALIVLLVAVGFGIYVLHWEHRPHVLEIYCFALDKTGASPGNVAFFIRTPDGHTILIDGGKSSSIVSALGSVMPFYRRSIDTIISTNPDDSHVTGLASVIARYHVGKIVEFNSTASSSTATINVTSSAYSAFTDEISKQKIPVVEVSAGDSIGSGDSIDFGDPAISAQVLFPPNPLSAAFQFSKTNRPILAFLLRYGSTTVLFGGDLTKKEQEYVGQEIASSTDFVSAQQSPNRLLILPHAENVGGADESFFESYNPHYLVALKKPATGTRTKNTSQNATKSVKSVKPKKEPFDVASIPNMSIVNLTTDGNTEFISNGTTFSEFKLK